MLENPEVRAFETDAEPRTDAMIRPPSLHFARSPMTTPSFPSPLLPFRSRMMAVRDASPLCHAAD